MKKAIKCQKGSLKRVYGKPYAYVNTTTGKTFDKAGNVLYTIKLRKK